VRDEFSTIDQTARIPVKCHYTWFEENLSSWCPYGPVNESEAEAQTYESGLTITQGTMSTAFFDEPGDPCRAFFTPPDGEPDIDLPQPPPNRFTPGEGVAILWMGLLPGTEDLRSRLGWPISTPDSYLMKQQCERTPEGQGSCFSSASDGRVFISPPDFVAIQNPDDAYGVVSTCAWIDSPETTQVAPMPLAGDGLCTEPFFFVWASHDLEGLTHTVQDALDEAGIAGARVRALAYGENWVEYDEPTGNSEICNFSVLETDFQITLPVKDLSDLDNLGDLLAILISVLDEFPPEDTPGSQPGIIRITFTAGDKILVMQFSAFTLTEVADDGLTGVALYEALRN
jgi:hypothetical protein